MIKLRRDTLANWTANNPIPEQGQACFEYDTFSLKIGDGVSHYLTLPYIAGVGAFGSIAEPLVSAAPSVYSFSNDIWIFLFERPSGHGLYAYNLEVVLENVALAWSRTIKLGDISQAIYPKQAFDVTVKHRWRNNYRSGGADGWGPYSATSTAFQLGSATPNAAYDSAAAFDNDPSDGSLD